MVDLFLEFLRGLPIWSFLAALALLPLVGMPLSPLWILAGVTYGFWTGLGLIIVAMAMNFALAYFIAKRWMHGPLTRLFHSRGIRIPEARAGEYIKLTIAVRLMPFVPQFMQSYLLGLANIPFPTYYFFSFPSQIAYAVGFLLIGDSLFNTKIGGIILGLSILCTVALLVGIARERVTNEVDLRENSK